MIDAIHLFHLVRGPLRTLARHWMCRGLRSAAFAEPAASRFCPSCNASATNGGRAIAIRKS
jgi:hypothetical protein